MIERVNSRLVAWAEETKRGDGFWSSSCTLASLSPLTKMSRRKPKRIVRDDEGNIIQIVTGEPTAYGKESSVPVQRKVTISDSILEVEQALSKLDVDYYEVVRIFYMDGDIALATRARRLSISVATMYRRIDAAHVILDSILYRSELPRVSGSYPQA